MEDIIKILKVNKIKTKDFGIIKNVDIEFKDGLNIVIGPNASGKTTVINFLKNKFDPKILSAGKRVMLEIDKALGLNKTILIGDSMSRLPKENLNKTLNKLSNSGKQIILTLKDCSDISKVNANIIDTKNFELKKIQAL